MVWSTFLQGLIFLCLGYGIVGNFLLFRGHLHNVIMNPEKKPTDLILTHLGLANTVIICASGNNCIIRIFSLQNFLTKSVCKIIIYMGRVARSLSICTTCLLNVVQAITLSPRTTAWRKLKPRSAWQVLPPLLLFWVLSFLISSNLLYYITVISSTNRSSERPVAKYCKMLPPRPIVKWFFLTLMTVRDLIFQGLMGWSSSYMVFRLYQHHKCVLYLQPSRLQGTPSPEMRATQSVLMLMICFLFFYWADCIFSFYLGSPWPKNNTVLSVHIFLSSGYACFSPLVLISRDVRLVKCWQAH